MLGDDYVLKDHPLKPLSFAAQGNQYMIYYQQAMKATVTAQFSEDTIKNCK